MNARIYLFIFITVVAAGIGALIQQQGWERTWKRWELPARTPAFSDLRVITGAGDSLDRGFDPREENPGAPFKQRFNQTSVWYGLRWIGVREAQSTALGIVLLCGYAVGLWWICAGINRLGAVLIGALVFSPALLLAVERGTTDLSVFLLLALAGLLAGRTPAGALGAVFTAFVLKLFPLAGVLLVLRESPGRAWRWGGLVLGGAVLFCALNFREIVDIGYKTEKGRELSYGWAALSLHLRNDGVLPWVCAVLAFGGLLVAAWRGIRLAHEEPQSRGLDFFRIGAGVYGGTFLLGASWDYRLIFTLLMMPQVAAWACDRGSPFRLVARVVLGSLLVAAWSPVIASHAGMACSKSAEELAKWSLFFGSIYLLSATVPGWLKWPKSSRAAVIATR
jgi:hypothetical protein